MIIKTTARNMAVTEALERQIEKKLGKLNKFFDDDVVAQVKLSGQKNVQCIEVTIPFNGMILRCEEKNEDMYVAIDLIIDKLVRQLRKNKTKLSKRLKVEAFSVESEEAEPEEKSVETLEDDEVIKIKRFPVKPQDTEEALLQMKLLGHDFYVFVNAESNQVNVLYKRNDGKFGLIEPDYE